MLIKTVGQLVIDRLSQSAGPWEQRLLRTALRLIRHLGDPAVRISSNGRPIYLPISHDLPLHRSSHPGYSTNLARIAACMAARFDDLAVIDVGANVGDSLALLRSTGDFPVL